MSNVSSKVRVAQSLSYGQQALWLLHNCSPGTGIYNVQFLWEIPEHIDLTIFKRSLEFLTLRHPSLGGVFREVDGVVVQKIDTPALYFEEIFTDDIDDADFQNLYSDKELKRDFDLFNESPMRWVVFHRPGKTRILATYTQHIGIDLWSTMTLFNELRQVYPALEAGVLPSLPPIECCYSDFVDHQAAFILSNKGNEQLDYWLKELAGLDSTLNLPTDYPRPPKMTCNGSYFGINLEKNEIEEYNALARDLDISLFSLYIATFHLLLHKYSNQRDIAVGTPTGGRGKEFAGVYNYFVNPVVIRSKVDPLQSTNSFLQQVFEKTQLAIENQHYPLSLIAEKLSINRSSSQSQLFQTSFVWENINSFENRSEPLVTMSDDGEMLWDMKGLGVWKRYERRQQLDDFDLTFKLSKFQKSFIFGIEYNADLFSNDTIERMSRHFRQLMSEVSNDPTKSISDLVLLTPEERGDIVTHWNTTSVSEGDDKNIVTTFSETVARYPDAIAVDFEGDGLSYRELDERSNSLARYLAKQGVSTGNIVGISLNRSCQMIVAIVGIFKAGGAYLPLDPEYPSERLEFMIDDANVSVVVTDAQSDRKLPRLNYKSILVDRVKDDIQAESSAELITKISPTDLAYVIYTSGSTGKPKGVMVEHSALTNLLLTQRNVFDITYADNVLLFASLNFDASIFSISLSLQNGATLFLGSKESLLGDGLVEFLNSNEITWVLLPPSIVSAMDPDQVSKLKTLVVGGEACSLELAKAWSKNRDLFNAYGPTESTVWATVAKLDGKSAPSIGKPVANTCCYILDDFLGVQPVGVPGELYLAGKGLARGYLNRKELTEEKFIQNPFSTDKEGRLYGTGDLCSYRPDGSIEYLGRLDHQVKIRGFRIELGEIEAAISEHGSVADVLVVANEGDKDDSGTVDKYLVAYVIKLVDASLTQGEIKKSLEDRLPDYMVPSSFVFLDAFPLTPNKKIDREKLPSPKFSGYDGKSTFVPPRNEIERILAEVWVSVLPVDNVSIFENFFDLGGHSLLLAKVFGRLPEMLKKKVTMVDLFKYPTIQALSHYLEKDEEDDAFYLHQDGHFERLRLRRRLLEELIGVKVAIVGMSGRFPGADTTEEFWHNIASKVESIKFYSKDELEGAGVDKSLLDNPNYVRAQSCISNVRSFDAEFFGFSPREAQITDPQQRIFLECAWEALEDGGYVPDHFDGRTGVYAGVGMNHYMMNHLAGHTKLTQAVGDYPLMIGNDKDFLSTRISYKLNLNGPAVVVQTACSTSLVAVHSACQALLSQECDAALAGGVSLGRLEKSGYLYQRGMIMSPDGHCRAFDEKAEGTIQGQGAGVVLLKRLDDALRDNDHIYGIIKGSATNNDGSNKPGYTSPAVEGQAKAILAAIANANIVAEDISYVETHGTATQLGDPIEIEGLSQAYVSKVSDRQPCAIGSVKSNIGHLDAASGVVGLIKTAKALDKKLLPPTVHFEKANEKINFDKTPFYVNTNLKSWVAKNEVRYAGVSSFGIGGTNAHVILREAPKKYASEKSRPWRMLLLSAKTPSALDRMTERLVEYLKDTDDVNFSNVCYTLQMGRKRFDYRRYLVCRNEDEAIAQLSSGGHKDVVSTSYKHFPRKIVFMFSGQGSQYINMAKHLYQVEVGFREEVKKCRKLLRERFVYLYENLSEKDFSAQTETLHQTYITQPSLFILEYALAKTLMSWGIEPKVMIGHSVGEYVAACLAGVFTLEQALEIVAIRGKLIQNLPGGEMLSVQLPEKQAREYLTYQISLAAVNGESRCVFSGQTEAILDLQSRLGKAGIQNRLLHTSHGFHSHMMESILDKFKNTVARRAPKKPEIPIISSMTGDYLTDEQATSAEYWAQHLRKEVRFDDGLSRLFTDRIQENEGLILLEVGPGKVLSTLAKQHRQKAESDIVISTMRHAYEEISDIRQLLKALGRLWANNVDINWSVFHNARQRYKVPLPTYPFERQEYWIAARERVDVATVDAIVDDDSNVMVAVGGGERVEEKQSFDDVEKKISDIWSACLGIPHINLHDDFFDLGGDSLIAVSLVDKLSSVFETPIATHVLIQKSTIGELADHIKLLIQHPEALASVSGGDQAASPLVLIQKGSAEKRPLFMVHPIGGEVYFYRDLARNLGSDQPLYAFQAPGLSGHVEPLSCVHEIAKQYIKELKLLAVEPPYMLGGSSFGGLVAFEMAQQLKAEGDDLALLVMIDTPTPQDMPTHLTDSAAILQYLLKDEMELSVEELRKFEPKSQIDYVLDKATHDGRSHMLPSHLSVSLFNTWIAHQKATFNYSPVSYDGDVLFYCHTVPMEHFPSAPHRSWSGFVEGRVSVHHMPGDHISMNYHPHITKLADHLKSEITLRLTIT